MLNYCIFSLGLKINDVVVDWSQVATGVLYFVVAAAVIFVVLLLTTSILRFQHLIGEGKRNEDMDPEESFVVGMAGRIATLRSRPPPFALLLITLENPPNQYDRQPHDVDLNDLAERIHALIRSGDEFSVSASGEVAFLVEASRENMRAVQTRIAEQVAQIELKDGNGDPYRPDVRFGCAHFPESGESVDKIFEAARTALARAVESETSGAWEYEPPFEDAQSETEEDSQSSDSLPSYIDPATGLLKPARSRSTAQKFLSQFRREGDSASIMIIKIDGLERLFSDYGEGVIEPVRGSISATLQQELRDEDLIACWGEDGFLVGINGGAQAAAAVAKRLLGEMRQKKVAHENYRIRYSVSIGVATYPINGRLPREILDGAEVAQREARDMGRNIFAAFEPKMLKRDKESRISVNY